MPASLPNPGTDPPLGTMNERARPLVGIAVSATRVHPS